MDDKNSSPYPVFLSKSNKYVLYLLIKCRENVTNTLLNIVFSSFFDLYFLFKPSNCTQVKRKKVKDDRIYSYIYSYKKKVTLKPHSQRVMKTNEYCIKQN
jgi:hypothetical protein